MPTTKALIKAWMHRLISTFAVPLLERKISLTRFRLNFVFYLVFVVQTGLGLPKDKISSIFASQGYYPCDDGFQVSMMVHPTLFRLSNHGKSVFEAQGMWYSHFSSSYVGWGPASTAHPQKISGILSTPKSICNFSNPKIYPPFCTLTIRKDHKMQRI